jgi:hypothetical protein
MTTAGGTRAAIVDTVTPSGAVVGGDPGRRATIPALAARSFCAGSEPVQARKRPVMAGNG